MTSKARKHIAATAAAALLCLACAACGQEQDDAVQVNQGVDGVKRFTLSAGSEMRDGVPVSGIADLLVELSAQDALAS